MEKSFKSKSKAFIVLLIVTVAFAVFTATTVLSVGPDKVAEASTASSISLSQLAGGNWTWSDYATKVTIGQWKGSSFKRYTDNTLGVGYCFDSGSWVSTSTIEYTVPNGQTIESFSLSITTTAAVTIQYQIYKSTASSPYGNSYPDSGISAQSGNTYSVTNSKIYHRNTYKATTLTSGDRIKFSIYDDDIITHSGSTIYTGGKVARDGNIAVTALSITLNNAAYSVNIKAGTGISDAFLSTSSDATSGSASGTEFDVNAYVYGFVKLAAGYRKPNSANWTLIDGTANQANAIYRVAEQKVASKSIDFGTINAEAKTKDLYKMDGAVSKGYETLNWGQAKTIPAITKTGYNFINYNTVADGTGTTYGNSSGASLTATQVNAIIDGSITSFYAQWSAKTFEVTFNKEGGTGGDDGVTMTYDQPAPGSIAVPSKPGYIFREYTATHPTNYTVITVYNSNGEATSSKWQIDSAVSPRATWNGKPYKAYITAGTGVKSVYLSSSSTATPGSSDAKSGGTTFTNGQYLCAYIVLERGYVAPAGWELSAGDYYVGDGVFRKSVLVDIASDEEEDLQYDFGTIDATKGNFAVGVSAGTGVSAVNLSAKDDGADLVSAGSKFVFNSQVYAYATLSVGYNAQDEWTLIDGESDTAGALYLVGTIEHIDIDSDFGALSATPKQYTVTLDGLDDPITATYDAPLSALEQLPTREGYTFIGYYDQPEDGNQYINEDGTSTGRTWKINEDAPQLYAHWLKTLCYEVTNYHGDYDRNPHTISYAVTEPESGAVILFGTAEDDYVLAENELPTYTDVGVYTIYYQISADVGGVLYKTVKGSATVTITKVNTTALSALIEEVNDYYDAINGDYPTIASTLEGHKQQIVNDYINEDNVTEAEVAAAVVELRGYLDKAHADIVDELIDAIGAVELDKEDEIYSARVAYNNLTDSQKALVVDLEDLVDAEVELVELLIANVAPFEYTQACKDRIEKARAFYNDLTADQKTEVDNYQDLVNAEKAYDAIQKIKAIGEPVVNDDATREKATTARAAYAGLSDEQKALVTPAFVTDLENAEDVLEFLDALNDIGASADTKMFRDKVKAARDLYDALDEADLETLVKPEDLKTLTDDEAAINVMDLINAIGTVAYDGTSKGKIDTANTAYDLLDVTQKTLVANYGKLEQANVDYNEVNALHGLIGALDPFEYSEAYEEKLVAAREAYEALSPFQQSIVPDADLKALVDAEKAFDAIRKIEAIGKPVQNDDATRAKYATAKAAVDALTDDQGDLVDQPYWNDIKNAGLALEFLDAVNAIGDPRNEQSFKDAVNAARDVYDDIERAGLESLVTSKDLKTLTDDEATLSVIEEIAAIGAPKNTQAFRDAVTDARDSYDDLTEDQKAIFPADLLKDLTDDEAIIPVLDAINDIGEVKHTPESKALINDAREAYEDLTKDQKAKFPSDALKALIDAEKAYEAMDKIHDIGVIENTADSKDKIKDARDAYDALTKDQKGLVLPEYLKALTDAEAVAAAMNAVNAIADVEFTPEEKERINTAKELLEALTDDQKTLVPDGVRKDLSDKEAAYNALGKIDAIGDVELTPESKALIDDARETYEALSDDQKALVPPEKLQDLINAEKAYEAMVRIHAIGETVYTTECKELIDEARAYFDALTDDQKAAVDNYATLVKAEQDYAAVDAEVKKINAIANVRFDDESRNDISAARTQYEALTDDQKEFFPIAVLQSLVDNEQVILTLEKITAIGTVKYDETSESIIKEARDAYDELTQEQKDLIHLDDFGTLTAAEEDYSKLHDNAKTTYTVLLVFVCLLLVIGLLILAYLVYRIVKDKREKTRVYSVAYLPFLLGASHYIDSPFLALYVLAALTLLVFAVDLFLALKYPHFFKGILTFVKSIPNLFRKGKEETPLAEKPEELVAPVPAKTAKEDVVKAPQPVIKEEDNEEEEVIVTENGTFFRIRFVKSFTAKLIQSSDETKAYYQELKNEVLSYKGIKSRISWHYDSFNFGRNQVIKFSVRGKTLCVYFALDIKDLKGSKYRVELCESSKYAAVPCMYRIRNDRRCEYAKELIAMVAAKFGLAKGVAPNEEYSFPYENNEALLEKGLIKELKTVIDRPEANDRLSLRSVNHSEADAKMSDEVAASYIVDDTNSKAHKGKKGIINIDTIAENFNDGDTVDIEALWEKKLISKSVGYVKVLARGRLGKRLNLDLQDYSIQAVKMVILEGGTVKRAK